MLFGERPILTIRFQRLKKIFLQSQHYGLCSLPTWFTHHQYHSLCSLTLFPLLFRRSCHGQKLLLLVTFSRSFLPCLKPLPKCLDPLGLQKVIFFLHLLWQCGRQPTTFSALPGFWSLRLSPPQRAF